MSKIEEALEKANQFRESGAEKKKSALNIFSEVAPVAVGNDYIATLKQPDSPVAEEFRRLKSMIIRETKADFLNSIMITSSIEGEGKSTIAANLAVSMAQELDHSVLLVDADLRKPRLHQYLGIDCKYGLSDYLTGDIDLSEILIKTGIGNLVFLPAGHAVTNPVELLSSKKMIAVMEELKRRYVDRYILVDTPPILSFAEGITMASCVDGIVFVVKERRAQKKTIEDALNMVKDLKVLGIVYNDVDEVDLNGYYSDYFRKHKNGGKR